MTPTHVEPTAYPLQPPGRRPWSALMRVATRRLEIPRRLRALVRARESSLVALAAAVGAIAGLVVAVMGDTVDLLHEIFFHLAPGERLSGRLSLNPWLAVLIPTAGGIIFGIIAEVIRR